MIVLLVEDDPDLRRVLEILLENHFEVRSCATSGDGLRKLRTERVDVLLIDLDLPGSWGEVLLRTAKTLPNRVAIVAMSANPALIEASRDVADAVIAKPFPLAAVTAALRRSLGCAESSGK
jgi:two-component system response regulator TctD